MVAIHFENTAVRDVTFTDCDSNFDTTMYLGDSQGNAIQDRSDNKCDGDDCADPNYCSTAYRETFTMRDLAVGGYTLLLSPYHGGGAWSVEVECATPSATPLEWKGWHPSTPLSKCQGDCDSDDDCSGDLSCFQSDAVAPGCWGRRYDLADYCYDPSSSAKAVAALLDELANTPPASWMQLMSGKDMAILVLMAVNLVGIMAVYCLCVRSKRGGKAKYQVVALEGDTDLEEEALRQ